jgi:RES domain-containing protein
MHASGRWHTIGHRITYCTYNPSAALLEALAHLAGKTGLVPDDIRYHVIDLPEDVSIERIDESSLPANWKRHETYTRAMGDKWLISGRTALLEVPSVLTPQTFNILLNPGHPESARITVLKSIPYPLDSRLIVGLKS